MRHKPVNAVKIKTVSTPVTPAELPWENSFIWLLFVFDSFASVLFKMKYLHIFPNIFHQSLRTSQAWAACRSNEAVKTVTTARAESGPALLLKAVSRRRPSLLLQQRILWPIIPLVSLSPSVFVTAAPSAVSVLDVRSAVRVVTWECAVDQHRTHTWRKNKVL